jgi:hypothetical protein
LKGGAKMSKKVLTRGVLKGTKTSNKEPKLLDGKSDKVDYRKEAGK